MTTPDRDDAVQSAKKIKNPAQLGAGLSRKVVHFNDLALCGSEVWIEYQGKLYRLQSTRQGKLVLTK